MLSIRQLNPTMLVLVMVLILSRVHHLDLMQQGCVMLMLRVLQSSSFRMCERPPALTSVASTLHRHRPNAGCFLSMTNFNKLTQTALQVRREKGKTIITESQTDSDRCWRGCQATAEIHELSGVGCLPLTNLSHRQHRCVSAHADVSTSRPILTLHHPHPHVLVCIWAIFGSLFVL